MQGLAGSLAAPKSGQPPTREVIDLTLDDDMHVDEVPNHRPSEHTTQSNGVALGVKNEPNGDQVTFVSTLAHRAQSSSPQKQKQQSLENVGFLVSKKPESLSASYHHSPYDSGDNGRSYRAASTTIPQKRKSQSAEVSVSDSSVELSFVSQNDVLDNGVGSSSTGPSLKALGKRPTISLKTPPPQLPPADSVSVVIPSPSAAQRQQIKPSQPDFIGISERYFPTGREERVKADRRRYPIATDAQVNKKVVPFTVAKLTLKEPELKKPVVSLSLARSVFPPVASASDCVTEPETQTSTAKFLRKKLRKKLKRICGGPETQFTVNDVQLATLSANFFFVGDYRLGPGVTPIDDDFLTGCDCGTVCDPRTCRCLIEEEDSDELIVAYERLESGMVVLRKDFLDRKAMISECSSRCLCAGSDCWNHVVQRGRQVRLEVFDAGERGLGLRCLDPLIVGQFIDCYFGEVITKKDADARESANEGKPSYLFNLDWLLGNGHHTYEESYVVDGQKFGTPTRYINHSCNPNCKIIPVSTNRLSDQRLYYLAFFAIRDIPAQTELTFDYHPKWDQEKKQVDPNAVKCLCGEENCRGQLWPNIRKKGLKEDLVT